MTNIVFKQIGSSIDIYEFVNNCVDNSGEECDIKFKDEESVNSQLQTAGGPYDVEISSSDKAGNTTDSKAIMYVTDVSPYLYLRCRQGESDQTIDNHKVKKSVEDVLLVGEDKSSGTAVYNFLDAARRAYIYVFETVEDYNAVAGAKGDTITFDDIEGHASYYDDTYTLIVSTNLEKDTLSSENNDQFPSTFAEIKSIYEANSYSCNVVAYTSSITN